MHVHPDIHSPRRQFFQHGSVLLQSRGVHEQGGRIARGEQAIAIPFERAGALLPGAGTDGVFASHDRLARHRKQNME